MKALTKEEMAEELAKVQYHWDDSVIEIHRVLAEGEDQPDEPLKLLVVSEDTVPAGIMPLYFPPDAARGFVFPFVITVITPDEQRRLNAGLLSLPAGWRLNGLVGGTNQRVKTAA